jgi:hypothetical protein
MATPNVCLYNKFGYCKHKEACRKRHENKLCDNSSCDFSTCMFRHPKTCKWYHKYGRCKFDPCAFKHIEMHNLDDLYQENKDIKLKLSEIEKSLKILEEREIETENLMKIKQIEEKVETFVCESNLEHRKKIDALEKLLKAKDDKFKRLELEIERKFETFESNLKTLRKCVDEKDLLLTKLQNKQTKKSANDEKRMKCSKCDFVGNSNHGLKIHMARKHTEIGDSNSNKCDFCESIF